MTKRQKQWLVRILVGGFLGVAVLFLIGAAMGSPFFYGSSSFRGLVLVDGVMVLRLGGQEGLAVAVQILLFFLLGAATGVATLPFADDGAALLRRTLAHFAVTAVLVALLAGLNFGRYGILVWLLLLVVLYLLWGVLLLGWNTRWCAYRALSVNYRNAPMPLFILALLVLTLWLGHKSLSAFSRAGEIFALALGSALLLALMLATLRTEWNNVGPIWLEDLPGAVGGVLPVLGLAGYGVLGAFLAGQVKRREENRGRLLRWGGLWCALLAVFQLICIGCFGPGLLRRMETPFFMLLRGVGVPGAFERVESLIMSLWLLADLTFLGLILFVCRAMVRYLGKGKEPRWTAVVLVAAAAGLALFTLQNLFGLSWLMERLVPLANVILGCVVPLAAGLVVRWKKGKEHV